MYYSSSCGTHYMQEKATAVCIKNVPAAAVLVVVEYECVGPCNRFEYLIDIIATFETSPNYSYSCSRKHVSPYRLA